MRAGFFIVNRDLPRIPACGFPDDVLASYPFVADAAASGQAIHLTHRRGHQMGIIVAIDGPGAAGKGTLGRALAAELDLAYLDTGKIYRGVARLVILMDVDPSDEPSCTRIAALLEAGDMQAAGLQTEEIGQIASRISAIPGVRAELLLFQQRFAENPPDGKLGAVLDGRDIGTVVCPDAHLKLFLTADPDIRARRRFAESQAAGENATFEAISTSIRERDHREATRAVAPMRPADDAIILDTSYVTASEILEVAVASLASRIPSPQPLPAVRM